MPATDPRSHGLGKVVRIYVARDDQWQGHPLHDALVQALLAAGVAGATVHHGVLGYGASQRLRPTGPLRLGHDAPVMITAVDSDETIRSVLPLLETMISEGVVAISDVEATFYRYEPDKGAIA